jgi:xanthine/uracil permease
MIINRNRAGLLNLRNQNAVPPAAMSGNMAKREEEEDNPYDRQFFGELIANAYAASLGGKPPTPYAQGVGTLRNFTALPFA